MTDPKGIHRILDANFNRAREGLRVLEEVARFAGDSAVLQRGLKSCRHALTGVLKSFAVSPKALLGARDTMRDVGKKPSDLEERRDDVQDIFMANAQRVKESLRALEEFSKLADVRASRRIKEIRFRVYALEKKAVSELEALRDHMPGENGRPRSADSGRGGHSGRRRRSAASRQRRQGR